MRAWLHEPSIKSNWLFFDCTGRVSGYMLKRCSIILSITSKTYFSSLYPSQGHRLLFNGRDRGEEYAGVPIPHWGHVCYSWATYILPVVGATTVVVSSCVTGFSEKRITFLRVVTLNVNKTWLDSNSRKFFLYDEWLFARRNPVS